MSDTEKRRFIDTWEGECEKATFYSASLLRLGKRRVTASALLAILRTAPHSPKEKEYADGTLFMRCMTAAIKFAPLCEEDLRKAIFDYFIDEFSAMNPKRRALLEASVTGVLIGMGMGG